MAPIDVLKLLHNHIFANPYLGTLKDKKPFIEFYKTNLKFISFIKMKLNPKESGEFIVKHAKYITINQDGIDRLASKVLNGIQTNEICVENFSQHEHHPKSTDSDAINWLFLIDTLNFCFWTKGSDTTKWKINNCTGYFALCAAINRARQNKIIDIVNPYVYAKITKQELLEIFKSDDDVTEIPLIDERLKCLHEVGDVLINKFDGKFENCIKLANKSAEKLLQIIINEFPCFRDEAEYAGERVTFYKRAQILIGDIWSCYRGKDLGSFYDIQIITMFADYRIPQVLIDFKALQYNDELLELLNKDTILKSGCEQEIEIRGASIFIVEKVKELLHKKIAEEKVEISKDHINAIIIDHYLWDYRRRFASQLEYIPFHKTLGIYY